MTGYRLEQVGGPLRFVVVPDRSFVVGRSSESDLVVADNSVSRRHAELRIDGGSLRVHDLGSANGTLVNGARTTDAEAQANDLIVFGSVAFRVVPPGGPAGLIEDLPAGMTLRSLAVPLTAGHDRGARALARLLEVSAELSGDASLDRLLTAVTDLAFEQVDADRVALLLAAPGSGGLEAAAYRNRVGDAAPRVPRAIAERAVSDLAPVITASAVDDERFQSGSVVLQAVRSAMCVPLLDPESRVLGALYADSITRTTPFDDDEARALQAFAGLAAVAIGRARYAEEARRAREVRAHFERFFAPEVAAAIARDGDPVALAGARLPVAVLFSDIRGFTSLAGELAPEEAAALLGDYLSVMVDAVFEHAGTLDKFIGDSVMAVWGAPLPDPDAADHALAAALAMRRDLMALNENRQAAGRHGIAVGAGIAYGEVFAGNVGSKRRLEYTVVGDTVNRAAHLCAAAGPGEILLAGEVVDRLTHHPRLTPADDLILKGGAAIGRIHKL